MAGRLLFLAHRIPYPPEKGEKIRAWHMLAHLAARRPVELGCLVDDPDDLDHLPRLREVCATVVAPYAGPRWRAAARALARARPGAPLSLGWFHHPGLAAWARGGLAAGRYDAVLAYSSAVAPLAMGEGARRARRRVLDLVDVDSEKWRAYAERGRGPLRPVMRRVWSREARTLLAFERRAALDYDRTLLVSEAEARRFRELAPEAASRIGHVDNGVDLDRFRPGAGGPSPYGAAPALVFTGTMGYRPNVEAVVWFAEAVLPRLRAPGAPHPPPEFWIVGADPAPAVRALAAREGVRVTGTVPDTRPYLDHAAAAVAPLAIARGIQNKVLEAMAMARPVVASPEAHEGVRAEPGRDLLVAGGAEETARAVSEVLAGRHPGLGGRARAAVSRGHDWPAVLTRLDEALDG